MLQQPGLELVSPATHHCCWGFLELLGKIAAMVLEKLGVGKAGTGSGQEKEPPVTRDILTCAQRVLELLGKHSQLLP